MDVFKIAQQSLAENPSLEKVILLKRNFRCDPNFIDPEGIKNRLSEFANDSYDHIWKKNGEPTKIVIADQNLKECHGELRRLRFGRVS